MSSKDFAKGYFIGLFTLAALDLLTADKVETTIKSTKDEILKSPRTEIIIRRRNETGIDTLIKTPAHIVPDTLLLKLKI